MTLVPFYTENPLILWGMPVLAVIIPIICIVMLLKRRTNNE